MKRRINAKTGLYALIGYPVKQSLASDIYNFGFEYYGLNDIYVTCEFSEKLEVAIDGIKALKLKGFNVTMPYKSQIVTRLDRLSNLSKLCGSVNTVKCLPDGSVYGDITDGHGFIMALQARGVSVKDSNVEIVGSGGAGRALAVAALVNGARRVELINRYGENYDRADALAKELSQYTGLRGTFSVRGITSLKEYSPLNDTDILVNATSLGMSQYDASIIASSDMLRNDMTVFDLVYRQGRTQLMSQAKQAGCHTIIGGKSQLLFQVAAAFRLFTDLEYPAREYLRSTKKIAYIVGFMGSGKTTIGESLANQLQIPFVDMDKYIENEADMTVAEIFRNEGEKGFRERETNALKEIIDTYKGNAAIVATGGGTLIQDINYKLMHDSGDIIHLDITFGEVIQRISGEAATKPLIHDRSLEEIGFLYRSRDEVYRERADYSIPVDNRQLQSVVNEIAGCIGANN